MKNSLKTQQIFKSERHNVFTKKKKKKIALSSNYYRRMQSIDSIETYAYGSSKDVITKEEEIKCNSIIKRYNNDYIW